MKMRWYNPVRRVEEEVPARFHSGFSIRVVLWVLANLPRRAGAGRVSENNYFRQFGE